MNWYWTRLYAACLWLGIGLHFAFDLAPFSWQMLYWIVPSSLIFYYANDKIEALLTLIEELKDASVSWKKQ